jgi:uncharacterized protein
MTIEKGTWALVTGGSSGIGFALANELASRGCNLVLCAEKQDALDSAAQKIKDAHAVAVQTVAVDLATREGVERLYATATTLGPIETFCANAGFGAYGDFTHTTNSDTSQKTDLDVELRMIDLNVKSTAHLTKLISGDMAMRGKGKILITASVDSFMPDVFQVVYAGTKAFDYAFAESLREFLRPKGVSVTALLPGATNTNFFRRANMMQSKVVQEGKLADPADVAKAAIDALADGEASVVHGVQNKIMTQLAAIAPSLIARRARKMVEPVRKAS